MDDTFIHTFAHCKACVVTGTRQQLEVGMSTTGLVVKCKRHGLVGHWSPQQLVTFLEQGPRCACCEGRAHQN